MYNVIEYHTNDFIKKLAETSNFEESWSVGKDSNSNGPMTFEAVLIMEELFDEVFKKRLEYSSVKHIKNVCDHKAYEWHTDADNPREKNISYTALVYLKGCEGSVLEVEGKEVNPKIGDIIILGGNTLHRAKTTEPRKHGPLLKYTFYDT